MSAPPAPDARAGAPPEPWAGLLPVDKPAGMTSHDVVDRARRRLRTPAVGHLGTLDPGASGLLLVAVGAATRCAPVWQGGAKCYEGTLRLGVVTDTQDLQGRVLETRPVEVDEAAVRVAAAEFLGSIEQVPPMVSALKVGGRRLHQLARRGETVERAARPVTVHAWEWLSFDLPEAGFRVTVSGGTYVRTLVHDLGQRLGAGAALAKLRRLRSEPFGVEQAIALHDLDEGPAVLERAGIALAEALRVLPILALDAPGVEALGFGRRVPVEDRELAPLHGGPRSVAVYDRAGRPLALGELEPDPERPGGGVLCPHVVFPWAVRQGRP